MLDEGNAKCAKNVVIHNTGNAKCYRLKGINTESNALREKECYMPTIRTMSTSYTNVKTWYVI